MRKYQPIWEQIKLHSTVSLAAETKAHARIVKAVRKEKDIDVGWKLLLLEQGIKYQLHDKIEGKVITFYLVDVSPVNLTHL